MTTTHFRRSVAALALVFSAAAACTDNVPGSGLEVVIATAGLTPGKDFDSITVQVSQQTSPGVWNQLTNLNEPFPGPVTLPSTFSIQSGTSSDQDALITVTANKGSVAIVQRIAQLQIPTNRLAELAMVLAADCVGQVNTCGANESCDPTTGTCGMNEIEAAMLPTYTAGSLQTFDAGNGMASGVLSRDGGHDGGGTHPPPEGGGEPDSTAPEDAPDDDAPLGSDSGHDVATTTPHDSGMGEDAHGKVDGGHDGGKNDGLDSGHDSGHDAGHDSGHDSGHDARHDSSHDSGHDSGIGAFKQDTGGSPDITP